MYRQNERKEVHRMNDVAQVIATLGFPIAMCVILCWYINKRDERTDKTLGTLTAAITDLSQQIRDLLRKED